MTLLWSVYSVDQLCHQYLWQPGVSARSYTGWHTLVQQTALFSSPLECIHIRYKAHTCLHVTPSYFFFHLVNL